MNLDVNYNLNNNDDNNMDRAPRRGFDSPPSLSLCLSHRTLLEG